MHKGAKRISFQDDSITVCGHNREQISSMYMGYALQDKFDEACKQAPASYWLADGVHPSHMGHWIIRDEWLKALHNL